MKALTRPLVLVCRQFRVLSLASLLLCEHFRYGLLVPHLSNNELVYSCFMFMSFPYVQDILFPTTTTNVFFFI